MKLITCKDETQWVEEINQKLSQKFGMSSGSSMYVPAGETPRPLYSFWERRPPQFLKNIKLLQMDEIISGSKKGLFRDFFETNLRSHLKKMVWIDCADQLAQVALLGLGMNGHIAFHEPGLQSEFFSGCLALNAETVERLDVEPGTKVVTYGAGAFLKSQSVVLIVRGLAKRKILNDILRERVSVPASLLMKHSDLTVIADFAI